MGPGVQEKEKAYKWKNTQYRARVEKSVFKSLQLRWTWKRHLREDLAEVPPIKRLLNWGSWAKNASIHKSKDVYRGNSYQRLCFNGCVPYLVCVCVCECEQLSPLRPGKWSLCYYPWSGLKDHTHSSGLEQDSSYMTLNDFCILNQSCILGINPLLSWYIILVTCYWIQYTRLAFDWFCFLTIFVMLFMRYWSLLSLWNLFFDYFWYQCYLDLIGWVLKCFLMFLRICGGSGGASGKEPTCQCRRHKRRGFNPRVGKIPWRRAWQPTPVFLPGESCRQRSLAGLQPIGSHRVRHEWSDLVQHSTVFLKHLVEFTS